MAKRGITPEKAKQIRNAKGIVDTKLQTMRLKKGYSQDGLAAKSGVAARTIKSYEQRKTAIERARFETLCKLCEALECEISDILEDETIQKVRIFREKKV